MDFFYIPDIDFKSGFCTLSEHESKHCIKVLRKKQGDRIIIVDGKGNRIVSEVSVPHYKRCELSLLEQTSCYEKKNYKLHIAIAPTKNISRYEWFVEKATEIGIDTITPIICQYSERRHINTTRIQKVITAAMKQSQKAYLPELKEAVTFKQLVESTATYTKKYIAHCYKDRNRKNIFDDYHKGEDTCILIGPEGDFSPEEITLSKQNNYTEIHMGPSRLRTETAGVLACASIYQLNTMGE